MSEINYTTLKAEIDADPLALGYAGKTFQQIADLMNGPDPGATKRSSVITRNDVLKFMAKKSLLPGFFDVGQDKAELDTVKRSIGLAAMQLFNVDTFDLDDPDNQLLINGAVNKSLMTAQDRTDFFALGDKPMARSEAIVGRTVSAQDIQRAQ